MENDEKTGLAWLHTGFLPVYVGFCPTHEAWLLGQKQAEQHPDWTDPPPESPARCLRMKRDGRHDVILIYILATPDPMAVIGLIAHEAMHALDFIIEAMADDDPSAEFKAYMMQGLTQELMHLYSQHHGRRLTYGRSNRQAGREELHG